MKRIRVELADSRRVMDDFFRVPQQIYADDAAWVPPLQLERKQALSPKQPVFDHLRWRGWVAYRGNRPVGRITAQIDALHQERYADDTGYFGFLELVEDDAVAAALFECAETWLRSEGMCRCTGPFSLNINQEAGLLVDGFDSPPYLMMGHARRYYGRLVENRGYRPARDVLAYEIDGDFIPPPVMVSLVAHVQKRVRLRPLERKNLDREMDLLRDLFNDAWASNWSFLPFTEREFRTMGRELTMLIPNDFIQIAEIDGDAVAFIVLLPNINEAIADLNGRLFPFGWAKLLWRLKVRYPTTGRIPLMGVRRRYQNTRLGPGLAFAVIDALRGPGTNKGIGRVEMSWILEDNLGMRNIIESLGGQLTKRYRVYEKTLQAP